MKSDTAPARFRWLPPGLKPPVPMAWRQERIFLLVGFAALFAGYDQNVFGLALSQIQKGLSIPEDMAGPTLSYFRLAAIVALLISASADLVGRRRLLLITIFGQAVFTLLTAFAGDYAQFVGAQILTRVFGYAEEMLCYVVIAEEVAAAARGWANGTISSLYYLGAGVASLVFAAVNLLPFGWRAIYAIGAVPLFLVAWLRRRLPETTRFAEREAVLKASSRFSRALVLLRDLLRQYPGRIFAVVTAAGAFGFGMGAASFLSAKYLQDIYHYTPGEVNLVFIPGGLIGLAMAILAGRLSDRLGRKPVVFAVVALAGAGFYLFYDGMPAAWMPALWVVAFFGFFCGDALIGGFALEIVPTEYRATVSGLRYVVEIIIGAIGLWLEGRLYDHFHAHGPAVQWLLATIPVTLLAILFLPEPAGKTLEDMAC